MTPNRYHYFDGLRGAAALVVLNYHFFSAFVPQLIPEQSDNTLPVSDTPLAFLYNGGFAVSVFFVLSGFVLAESAAKRAMPLLLSLARRYVWLAVPVFCSTLFAFAMLSAFRGTPTELHSVIYSEWLKFSYDKDLPDLTIAVKSGIFDLFTGGSMFNNVLWTIRVELVGSCLIYLIYASADRPVVLAGLSVILIGSAALGYYEIGSFAVGGLLREAVAATRLPVIFPRISLCIGLTLGSMMTGYGERVLGQVLPITAWPGLPEALALGTPHKFFHLVASFLVIYAFLSLPVLQKLFSKWIFRFLGSISFGLYLTHVPLIYSVVGAAYLLLPSSAYSIAAIYILLLTLSLVVGCLFTVLINWPTLYAIKIAQRRYLACRSPDAQHATVW